MGLNNKWVALDNQGNYLSETIIACLSGCATTELRNIEHAARRECQTRVNELARKREALTAGWSQFAVFMGNIAQAMACKQLLRWYKGHPGLGINPSSGEMWLPWELINASNTLINISKGFVIELEDINPLFVKLDISTLNSMQTVLRNIKSKFKG